jgi:hypothetical protein
MSSRPDQGTSQPADPVRLLDRADRSAALLRTYLEETVTEVPASRPSPAPRHSAPRAWWAAVVVGVGLAAAILLVIGPVRPTGRPATAPVTAAAPAPAVPAPARAPIAAPAPPRRIYVIPGGASVPLPAGQPVLAAGRATVKLAPEGLASVDESGGVLRVTLERGQVALAVEPRPSGPEVRVEAPPYTFAVLGTSFEVERTPLMIELRVREGRVAVRRGATALEVVGAGRRWRGAALGRPQQTDDASGEPPERPRRAPAVTARHLAVAAPEVPLASAPPTLPAAPATNPSTPQPATGPPAPTCEAQAERGTPSEAVSCYLRRADGAGLAAELSLFEAGRLRRDRLDDAAGALELFRAYRGRFPRGALRAEADLAVVGLLPRLGRYPEALDELSRLLLTPAGRERTGELELLRGNLYREGLGDCARAERSYETAATSAAGDRADEARLYRGTCLEALGRHAEAAVLYQQLAGRPGKYAAMARARLSPLR